MKDVLLDWHLGDRFGWGILGMNLFFQWAHDPDLRPVMGHPITRASLGLCDPLTIERMRDAVERSNGYIASIRPRPDGVTRLDATVIDALGNGFQASKHFGAVNIGRCIFEDTELSHGSEALTKYDALLVASHWNARLLEAATGRQAKVIFEGVDTSLFRPGERSGLMDDGRFHVFSGGKVEFRKGQDLVLLAFKRFSAMHDDCVLVTAWQSIWPQLSVGFRGRLPAAVELADHGLLDIGKWARQNGIPAHAIIDLGLVPNALMPAVLREMDVALQPSRAEACTNLPVKEAMACGVPVIAAANTGMLDLLDDGHSLVLKKQAPIAGPHTEGWGESDVDEIVAALEFAYQHRDEVRQIGLRSRDWLIANGRTWQAHAAELKRWILSLPGSMDAHA